MDFDLTEDQASLVAALDQIAGRHRDVPTTPQAYFQPGVALEQDLTEGGFFDIGWQEGMGPVEGVLMMETIGQLGWVVEIGASTIVAPRLSRTPLPRPIALARTPLDEASIRYAGQARTLLVDTGSDVRIVDLAGAEVQELKTTFGYPFARVRNLDLAHARVAEGAPEVMRQWWQVALAAEIYATGKAAHELTCAYVKQRRQFNRPIGSFQAVQHGLATCAVLLGAILYMTRRAASTGDPADAANAATYAQDAADQLWYYSHQYHGAMGITLECPLHLWSYRLKALQGELGGWPEQGQSAADLRWVA